METIPCPGCRTPLEPSATVCPICLRPRGKLEITRAYSTLREAEKQRKRRPFLIAGRLLAAGAVAGVLFRFHTPLLEAGASAMAHVSGFVDASLYPAAAPKPGTAATPLEPVESHAAPSAFPQAKETTGAAPPAAARAPAPVIGSAATASPRHGHVEDLPLPNFDASSQWVLYGRVYDLITLKPVADAQLNFSIVDAYQKYMNAASGPRTDSYGRFSVALRRLPDGSSYEIRVSRPDYASTALYESDIPYAKLAISERRDIVRNAQDGDMTVPPLNDIAGQESIRRDIFLAPRR